MQKINARLERKDGKITIDYITYVPYKPHTYVRITLHSRKNRIVRCIFEHLGYKIITLDRIKYVGLTIRTLSHGK
jgi:23S rRNA pseudouridine2605 synthase